MVIARSPCHRHPDYLHRGRGSTALLLSFAGLWLPVALIVLATWFTGLIMSTMPWPKAEPRSPREHGI